MLAETSRKHPDDKWKNELILMPHKISVFIICNTLGQDAVPQAMADIACKGYHYVRIPGNKTFNIKNNGIHGPTQTHKK